MCESVVGSDGLAISCPRLDSQNRSFMSGKLSHKRGDGYCHPSIIIPLPAYNRPSWIPRPVYLVLILLQPYQPPATTSHGNYRNEHSDQHACETCFPWKVENALAITTTTDRQSYTTSGAKDKKGSKRDMTTPSALLGISPEYREKPEDFDAEEC